MLSDVQRQTFAKDGLLHLPGVLPDDIWRPLAGRVRRALRDAGLGDPDVPQIEFKHRRKRATRALMPHLGAIYTDQLCAVATHLLGGQAVARHRALLLVTLPGQSAMGPVTRWSVPRQVWHTDAPRVAEPGVPGVIALGFLDQTTAGGGGTLFVAGSHRLLDMPGKELRSKAFKRALRKKPYFNVLLRDDSAERTAFLAKEHRVEGVDVRVVELTGEPGDVVLADARLLHAPGPNVQSKPRLMVRGFFIGEPLAVHYRTYWPDYASPPGDAPRSPPDAA
ncbi:MAG: phytanoyl-CoA dioxygenase family protein [Gammaproteobacteria bacterium]|nr:phytanoyl-CoA dioxygenase family protein [Gammaproteobacteria bacterium]